MTEANWIHFSRVGAPHGNSDHAVVISLFFYRNPSLLRIELNELIWDFEQANSYNFFQEFDWFTCSLGDESFILITNSIIIGTILY